MATGKKTCATLTPTDDKRGIAVTVKLPDIVLQIVDITWKSGIDTARNKNKIIAPHWMESQIVNEENKPELEHFSTGSKKPGVYLIKKSKGVDTFEVKVRITKNTTGNTSGNLRGTIGPLQFEGTCALGLGIHTVLMKFNNLPDVLTHVEGDATWGLDTKTSCMLLPIKTRLELFVILRKPMNFYTDGVWVEALRFAFKKAKVSGAASSKGAIKLITTYCHTGHGMVYDTFRGAAHFDGASAIDGGIFDLWSYMQKKPVSPMDDGITVNCYDQSAAVQVFSGALGIKMESLYQKPFGPIKRTNLVGVGPCNNPFFQSNGSNPIVSPNSPDRKGFNNHAFPQYKSTIYDACAGPHLGTENLKQYLTASIDADRFIVDNRIPFTPHSAIYDFLVTKNSIFAGPAGVK